MHLSKIIVMAITFLFVGGLSLVQGQADVVRSTVVVPVSGGVVGQCDGFQILSDGVLLLNIMDRYDPNGEWAQSRIHVRVIGEEVLYNSDDNAKAVSGGPGEGEVQIYDPNTGVIHVSGLSFKIRIPGYGVIFAETGTLVFQCDPYAFGNCSLVSNVGFNQFLDGDVVALCDYLQ